MDAWTKERSMMIKSEKYEFRTHPLPLRKLLGEADELSIERKRELRSYFKKL